MKKHIYIMCAIMSLILASCGQNKTTQNNTDENGYAVVTDDEGTPVKDEIKALQQIEAVSSATFNGKTYSISVRRSADKSLPVVEDTEGQRYYDNRIALYISADGKTVVDREFTKESFSQYLTEDFLKNSVLEGMVFDKTNASGLLFAASVSYPESDLYVPFNITIAADGKMNIEQADLMEDIDEPEAVEE